MGTFLSSNLMSALSLFSANLPSFTASNASAVALSLTSVSHTSGGILSSGLARSTATRLRGLSTILDLRLCSPSAASSMEQQRRPHHHPLLHLRRALSMLPVLLERNFGMPMVTVPRISRSELPSVS